MRTRATLTTLSPTPNTEVAGHLVVSLVGENGDTPRPRLGIIPVVDRSGSMAGQRKLAIVADTLSYLAGYLHESDQLALVAFDTTVSTLVQARAADQSGATAFNAALAALAPAACTNLFDGIAAGLAQGTTMPPDTLVRVIVLTDGQANAGITGRDQLLGLVGDLPANVSVSFLGVGTDADHDLLGALADAGRGSYGFIEAADRAADVLGAEIGGLLDVEVQAIKVSVRARSKYVRLGGVLGLRASRGSASEVSVELGDLQAGATRHVVIPVTLTGARRGHARPVTVADVSITGVAGGLPVRGTLLPKVHFGGPAQPVDPDLADAVDLAVVAHAQILAEASAQAGDFAGAARAFAGLDVHGGAALGLMTSLSAQYAGSVSYSASATMRASSAHALAGSLVGSGQAFDSLAARTIGAYTTNGQRDVAAAAAAALAGGTLTVGTVAWPAQPARTIGACVNNGLRDVAAAASAGLTGGTLTVAAVTWPDPASNPDPGADPAQRGEDDTDGEPA